MQRQQQATMTVVRTSNRDVLWAIHLYCTLTQTVLIAYILQNTTLTHSSGTGPFTTYVYVHFNIVIMFVVVIIPFSFHRSNQRNHCCSDVCDRHTTGAI